MKKLSLFVTVAATLMVGTGLVIASDYGKAPQENSYDRSDDHDKALQLREMGEIMAKPHRA